MAENFLGKSISIKCIEPAGTIFQGTIKEVTPDVITIVRAFRNGVPVRKMETEVKIASANIISLDLIPVGAVTKSTPGKHVNGTPRNVKDQQQSNSNGVAYKETSVASMATSTYLHQQQQQQQQAGPPRNNTPNNKKFFSNSAPSRSEFPKPVHVPSKPIEAVQPYPYNSNNGSGGNYQDNLKSNGNGSRSTNNNGNGKNGRNSSRYQNSKSETFGTPVNDPTMDQDFDFEKNLALFDKQAVWEKFNQMNGSKPDLLQGGAGSSSYGHNHRQHQPQPKYRHDENILQSAPTQYRQIEVDYNSSRDYVSDDGLIVPSIPLIVRNRLQTAAEAMGLTWERQIEILSRGACDTALQLLGGARRLKPNNQHQWPSIVVVCEEPYNER